MAGVLIVQNGDTLCTYCGIPATRRQRTFGSLIRERSDETLPLVGGLLLLVLVGRRLLGLGLLLRLGLALRLLLLLVGAGLLLLRLLLLLRDLGLRGDDLR